MEKPCFRLFAPLHVAKLVLEWSVHHGYRAIVPAHDQSAGGLLRFVTETAVVEGQLHADPVGAYRRTERNNLMHFFLSVIILRTCLINFWFRSGAELDLFEHLSGSCKWYRSSYAPFRVISPLAEDDAP